MIGNPSYQHFKKLIENKQITNCLVTVTDVKAAEDIFGPSVQVLKGKTTRKNHKKIKVSIVPLPIQVLLCYQHVELVGNVMRVNGILFLCRYLES